MNYRWIELWLCDSESIVCLVDTRNHSQEVRTLLFELRKLRIERMENLGALYHGVLPNGLFEKLEQLYIYKCPLLTCLFIPAVARNLVHLEKLEIVSCDGLKHVVGTEDEEISRHDDLLIFSKLKQLHISGCLMLEYTIPVTFAEGLVELESLEIYECYEMKYVFGQRTHGGQGQRRTPKIELPALEKLRLTSNSNMISIFPECCCTLWPSLDEFYLWDCPEFDIDVNTFDASRWEGVRDVDLEKHSITSETLVIYNSNAESIFNLDGLQTIGQPINLRLQYLRLSYLYQMKYICVGMKNTLTFRNLKTLEIYGCQKVEVIFPTSVLRCLPELERLEITECQELKQIIEDDDDLENERFSNFVSTAQPCFPKLVALVVNDCHNLERLFCVSVSNDLPNLELLIIWGATKLEELIGYGQGQGSVDQMQKVKVELPKLKLLVLTYLSSLNQEIELPTVTLCVVHNCTKLSLTSSFATLLEFEGKLSELEKDLEVDEFYRWKLLKMVGENIIKSNQVIISGVTRVDENTTDEDATARFPVGPKDQASCSKVCTTLSFDIEGGLGKKFDGKVTYSHIPTVIETSSAELNERPSTNHLDFTTLHNNAHSHREVEERATSFNAGLLTLSTHSKSDRQRPNLLFNSQGKSYKHTKIRLCQTEIYIDKQSEGHPINLKASEDDDDATEDNIVVKVISELEETLKLPLKDIASSEATILRLLTALKFLSQLPLEDVTLSSGLKAVIESLHHQFPSILCSFKQAFFAASHNPANEVAGKAELSSLHENVRRDKFKMMEDSRKARQQLFEVNYKWSALCSQFELNLIAARTP